MDHELHERKNQRHIIHRFLRLPQILCYELQDVCVGAHGRAPFSISIPGDPDAFFYHGEKHTFDVGARRAVPKKERNIS
jgi:hypothetical protein